MLETRNLPVSPQMRRLDAPRASSAAARLQTRGSAALSQVQPAPSPTVRPAAPARQSRLGRSEMRLMGAATTCTAVVCGLLLLYLAAYAQVTRLGIEQSQASARLRDNQVKNEMLRAKCASLESPQYVISQATGQGMMPRGATPIEYVKSMENIKTAGRETGGEQGTNGGTTDKLASTSFNH